VTLAGLGTVIFLIVYDRRALEKPYPSRPNTYRLYMTYIV
jgi:hypothetical protein